MAANKTYLSGKLVEFNIELGETHHGMNMSELAYEFLCDCGFTQEFINLLDEAYTYDNTSVVIDSTEALIIDDTRLPIELVSRILLHARADKLTVEDLVKLADGPRVGTKRALRAR